jgi:hypothetical protein
MSRGAPPEKKAGPREWHPNGPGKSVDQRAADYRQSGLSASQLYLSLIARRYCEGLLQPFKCFNCGILALDPLGWAGPHKPLCGRCAS